MATTVSVWAKPGAWALDSEESEAAELIQQEKEREIDFHHQQQQQQQPLSDFPSLSTAVATKSKKKKAVAVSLSQFTTGKQVTHGSARASQTNITQAKGLTTDELLSLPTGPRERTAEELERSSTRLGGGFRSYGTNTKYSNGGDDSSSNNRWGSDESRSRGGSGGGFNRENNRESGPSRADETDDWGAAKKSIGASSFERRERGGGGGFFDSQSRADESDSWVSNKSRVSSMPPRRVGNGGGFENLRERRGGFEFQKETSNGGGADSDTWGKKREEGSTVIGNGGRPKLVLKPRTISPTNGEQEQQQLGSGSGTTTKTKGSNPFGEARPREEVLAEKGQDWKKIDEQLESAKIKEIGSNGSVPTDGSSSFGKKSFGNGIVRGSSPEDRTERSWRKPEAVGVQPPESAEVENEDGVVAETES